MNKKEKLVLFVLAGLAMSSSGFAFGQSVNNVSNSQTIYACVTGINGNIVKVSNTQKVWPRGTTPISWNSVGPQGIQGIPGTAAAKGEKWDQGIPGPQGEQGVKGEKGDTGLTGAAADSATRKGLVIVNALETIKLPVFHIPTKSTIAVVEYDGLYWGIGQDKKLVTVFNFGNLPLRVYESADCSGYAFTLADSNDPFTSKLVYRDDFGSQSPLKLSKTSFSFSNLNSYLTLKDTFNQATEESETLAVCNLITPDGNFQGFSNESAARINREIVYDVQLIETPDPFTDWHFDIG